MDDERPVLACMPRDGRWRRRPPTPSVKADCDLCGVGIWASHAMAPRLGEMRAVCQSCARKVMAAEPEREIGQPTAEQVAEMRAAGMSEDDMAQVVLTARKFFGRG